jgi:hypothetical protein
MHVLYATPELFGVFLEGGEGLQIAGPYGAE